MPDTTATLLTLRIAGWSRSFDPQRPVSLGAHRYCNVLLPPGDGETPLRAAVFEWKNGAWVLSNASKRPFLLRAVGQTALSLAPGGSVALAATPFVLTVAGASAAADVEVSTVAVAVGTAGRQIGGSDAAGGGWCVCGASLPAATEDSPWEPDSAGRADLALMSPWAAEAPLSSQAATVVPGQPTPTALPAAAWARTLPPPAAGERILLPPPPGAWGFPAPTRSTAPGRRRGLVTALFLAIALVASAAGAAAWRGARVPAAPPHPSQWDPRLADIVSFVENERGLKFQHPVFVDYLPPEAFRGTLLGGPAKVSPKDRQSMDQTIGFFRALGLIEGNPDLLGGSDQLQGDGTLAYYDPRDQRVRVRGTELTEAVRATLAHELTHALQDQYFNLSRMGESHDAMDRFRAVVEGDAMRVETKWVDHLDPAARQAHDAGRAGEVKAADFSAVPEVLTALFSAPYDLGQPFVEVLHAVGGNPAVDRVLKSPPASEAQLLDPFRYLAGDAPLPVDEPTLHKGETRLDGGDFGAFGLYLMLAQRLDPRDALGAVDAWGGDGYVHFDRGGHSCVRADFVGHNPQATEGLAGTLGAWARAMPPGAASTARHDALVELNFCDPGPATTIGGPRLADAVSWPLARTYAALGAIEGGVSQDTARCYGGALLEAFTPEQVSHRPSAAQALKMRKLAAGCQHH
jgi:hypothetical protein